ncbi:sodium-dependent serotonin transporter-like [Paramacrobiotus metropolitanus]|uniref:sodium-dependent serotonin transporter-like n=1 Tax=Paramacrobiotus metropolitanus TaxID=2943436 RepID=UPI0024455FA8|nr:sodium-dependent serotonin transporter-like [Paramacrobiotus metropolitanus]
MSALTLVSASTVSGAHLPAHAANRDTWDRKIEFLLSIIGFCVDLGNVWRFPYVCYKNGGGAFLIPYTVMLILGGMPLFYLELALGQYYRSGCISIWRYICPLFKGVGFGICVIASYMSFYYNTIISTAIYYIVASFQAELPWAHCNHTWNTANCSQNASSANDSSRISPAEEYYFRQVLEIHKSDGIHDLGPPRWQFVCGLVVVFIMVYFALWKGPKSSGKAVWVTALSPFVVLFILLIRGLTLDGSHDGLKYFLEPEWSRLLAGEVWSDAAAQVFFSLGPGFGVLMALASYNPFHNNFYRDALLTSFINFFASFLSGLVVFSVLGYLSHVTGKEVKDVVSDGPGLVFVAYPTAIATMPGAQFWSVIFFIMLASLGLDSTFGGLEAILTAISDEFPVPFGKHRKLFCLGICLYCFLGSLPTTTYGGQYVITLLDFFGPTIAILFIVFVEAAAFCWFYGISRISHDVNLMLGHKPGLFWIICWTCISPVFILAIFILTLTNYTPLTLGSYVFPEWSVALGWVLTFSSILCIPGYIIIALLTRKGTLLSKFHKLIRPEEFTAEPSETVALNNGKHLDTEHPPVITFPTFTMSPPTTTTTSSTFD